jgi:hypothetical protein
MRKVDHAFRRQSAWHLERKERFPIRAAQQKGQVAFAVYTGPNATCNRADRRRMPHGFLIRPFDDGRGLMDGFGRFRCGYLGFVWVTSTAEPMVGLSDAQCGRWGIPGAVPRLSVSGSYARRERGHSFAMVRIEQPRIVARVTRLNRCTAYAERLRTLCQPAAAENLLQPPSCWPGGVAGSDLYLRRTEQRTGNRGDNTE